jgi:hypothetical protein
MSNGWWGVLADELAHVVVRETLQPERVSVWLKETRR